MTSARTAIAALLLLSGANSAKAQDTAGAVPGGSTATGQTEPAPGELIVRPKRGRLIDMIKAVDRTAVITDVRVEEKTGGRSGAWRRS